MRGETKIDKRRMKYLIMHEECCLLIEIYVLVCLFMGENVKFFENVFHMGQDTFKIVVREKLAKLSQ